MQTYNEAIAAIIPRHIFSLPKNINDFFYDTYDDYCKDVLMLFDEYVETEVNYANLYNNELPKNLIEHLITEDVELHAQEFADYMSKQVHNIIAQPFYDSLGKRVIKHKIGSENYNKIKYLIES